MEGDRRGSQQIRLPRPRARRPRSYPTRFFIGQHESRQCRLGQLSGKEAVCHGWTQVIERKSLADQNGESNYLFRQPVAGDHHVVTFVLHQPLSQTQHLDASGQMAWTMRRVGWALDALQVDIAGSWVSQTLPLIGPTGSIQASDSCYDAVCEKIIQVQVASPCRAFIVCGAEGKMRWEKSLAKALPGVEIVSQIHERLGKLEHIRVKGMVLRHGVKEFAVIFAPHPSAWHHGAFNDLIIAAQLAYLFVGRAVAEADGRWDERAKLVAPITSVVRIEEAVPFVELSVEPVGEPAGDESDRRYLLANGVLTHNCGLNLTTANNVFLCDSWWAPSAEMQAVDRVHRLGATKAVQVVRFVCKNTVEEKILKMQNDKSCMAMTALTRNTKARDTQQAASLKDLVHLFA
jgi:hypothetical protein